MADAFDLSGKEARGLEVYRSFEETIAMTFLMIEDALSDEEELAQQNGLTVKCSWCGEIIRLDGKELAPAMCQGCYERMLAEFLRAQQMNQPDSHASDQ